MKFLVNNHLNYKHIITNKEFFSYLLFDETVIDVFSTLLYDKVKIDKNNKNVKVKATTNEAMIDDAIIDKVMINKAIINELIV